MLLMISVSCYAQGSGEYTLFVGEFENRTDIVNPLLSYLSDTLDFLFSRSKLADIQPVSPGLRSAYLQRARNENPDLDAAQLTLLAAKYANADAVLVGFYTKTDTQWTMEAQLSVTREDRRARENIRLVRKDVYSLLDNMAAEVGKRLGMGQYMLLSTKSWEAYEAYRQGHLAYYDFNLMGAMNQFKEAIQLDPQLAVAQAELGISYAMMSMLDQAGAAFAEASKNLQYASEHEKLVVMGLEGFYKYYWVLRRGGGGLAGADMPSMREDKVWDEPWLSSYISMTSGDKALSNRVYKQWLVSATAYAEAGFYGVAELVDAVNKCFKGFSSTGDIQFLNAALQFVVQAADMEANDGYDDAWKYWGFADIYGNMGKSADAKKHREQWLQAIKGKPARSFPPDKLNDFAVRCLTMGEPEAALEFAAKAVELAPDMDNRALYLVTQGDAHLADGELTEAFDTYSEAFGVSARGDTGTGVLSDSLSGLARLVRSHPGFVDRDKRAKLNDIMNIIGDTDPLRFRGYSAAGSLYTETVSLEGIQNFCRVMGDMSPLLKLIRSLLREEAAPIEQLVYLSALVSLNGGVGESERNWLSSPQFVQAIADLNNPIKLGWVYEMIGEEEKALEAYESTLESESPLARMIASCALINLRHSLGEEIASQAHVYLEAEEAQSFAPYFEIAEAPEASGGRYLWAPDTFDSSHDGKGQAEYEFEIPQPGCYQLVARMLAETSYADCVRVSIGNNEADLSVKSANPVRDKSIAIGLSEVDLATYEKYCKYAALEWLPASKSFTLPAGKHRLVVHNKDDGVKLDCMVLYKEK